jgi:hypothetical protein
MDNFNIPGFTAETSLYKTRECYCGVANMANSSAKLVSPQQLYFEGLLCDWAANGDLICGEDLFGETSWDHRTAQCRAACYHSHGNNAALLNECLAS